MKVKWVAAAAGVASAESKKEVRAGARVAGVKEVGGDLVQLHLLELYMWLSKLTTRVQHTDQMLHQLWVRYYTPLPRNRVRKYTIPDPSSGMVQTLRKRSSRRDRYQRSYYLKLLF